MGPIQGTNPSQSQVVTPGGSGSSSIPAIASDTITSAGGVHTGLNLGKIGLAPPFLTVGVYLGGLLEAGNANVQQQAQFYITANQTYAKMSLSISDQGQTSATIQSTFNSIASQSQSIYNTMNNQIDATNTAATNLNNSTNSTDQDQINTVNTAISTYNTAINTYNSAQSDINNYFSTTVLPALAAYQNDPTPANLAAYNADVATQNDMTAAANTAMSDAANTFGTALNTYNAYMATRNAALGTADSAYSSSLTALTNVQNQENSQIAIVNQERNQFGIPALPSFNLSVPAGVPVFPSGAIDPALQSGTYTIPIGQLEVDGPVPAPSPVSNPFPTSTGLSDQTNPTPDLTSYFNAFIANLPPPNTTLKQSLTVGENALANSQNILNPFVASAYIQPTSTTPALNISNAGGGSSLAQVGGGSHLERAISNAIISTTQQHFERSVLLLLIGKIQGLGINLNSQTALLAAAKALGIFGVSANSTDAVNAAFSVTNAQAISSLLQSGVLEGAVRQIVEEQLGAQADQATIDNLTAVATAALNQELIQGATLELQEAFNTPGLLTQTVANGLDVSTVNLNPTGTPTALTVTVSDVLSNSQQNQALQATLAGELATEENISQSQAQEIVSNAFNSVNTENETITLSQLEQQLAQSFIAQDVSTAFVTTSNNITEEFVRADQEANEQVRAGVLSDQNTQQILTQQLEGETKNAQAVAQQILTNLASDSSIQTNAEFQAALQNQLAQYKISGDVALQISTETVGLTLANSPYASPLLNPTLPSVLSPNELNVELHQQVVSMLEPTVGTVKAGQIADAATLSLTSLIASYKQNQTILETHGATPEQLDKVVELNNDIASAYADRNSLLLGPRLDTLLLHTTGAIAGVPATKGQKSLDILV